MFDPFILLILWVTSLAQPVTHLVRHLFLYNRLFAVLETWWKVEVVWRSNVFLADIQPLLCFPCHFKKSYIVLHTTTKSCHGAVKLFLDILLSQCPFVMSNSSSLFYTLSFFLSYKKQAASHAHTSLPPPVFFAVRCKDLSSLMLSKELIFC